MPVFADFYGAASPDPVAALTRIGPFDIEPSVRITGRIEGPPPGVVVQCEGVREIGEGHVEVGPFEEAQAVERLRDDQALVLFEVVEGNMRLLAIDEEGTVLNIVIADAAHDRGPRWTPQCLDAGKGVLFERREKGERERIRARLGRWNRFRHRYAEIGLSVAAGKLGEGDCTIPCEAGCRAGLAQPG